MRQQVNVLAVVSFDAPAELSRAALIDATTDALRTGSFATAEPTGVEVRGLMEEAAIYNNNGDQFEVRPGNVLHQGGDKFRLVRMEYKDGDAVTGWSLSPVELNQAARDVAEALNFMAARVTPPPAPLPDYSAQMLAMLETVLDVCDMADPEHESFADSGADCLQVIFENEEKIRALVAKVKGGAA